MGPARRQEMDLVITSRAEPLSPVLAGAGRPGVADGFEHPGLAAANQPSRAILGDWFPAVPRSSAVRPAGVWPKGNTWICAVLVARAALWPGTPSHAVQVTSGAPGPIGKDLDTGSRGLSLPSASIRALESHTRCQRENYL